MDQVYVVTYTDDIGISKIDGVFQYLDLAEQYILKDIYENDTSRNRYNIDIFNVTK